MDVRRPGTWLAILAIALQAAWPLIAAAKPRSIALVPVCTVEGVTHYLEIPTGKTPLEESANAHHQHCSFCFLGMGGLLPSHIDVRLEKVASGDRVAPPADDSPRSAEHVILGARAPPLFPEVFYG